MTPIMRAVPLAVILLAAVPLLGSRTSSASAQAPTLPSDTLEANFAPPSELAPMPELAPSLPSDTIYVGPPYESYDSTATDSLNPGPIPDDSTTDLESRPQSQY